MWHKAAVYASGLALFLLSSAALAASDAKPLADFARAAPASTVRIDHAPWQALLDRHLDARTADGIHRFRYAHVNAADGARLRAYIDALAAADPRRLARAEQFAYWVNLYNALTVDTILRHYPVKSIRDIHEDFFAIGPWDDPLVTVLGQKLTLNDIEHRILRPLFKDPRVHYAVNCASLSCPNLAAVAYSAANLEKLLESGARAYVNHPRGVRFDKNGKLKLSSIYHWYASDFGADKRALYAHLAHYAAPALARRLRAYRGDYAHDYDWSLNQ